jgi:uncharacterized membrane protein
VFVGMWLGINAWRQGRVAPWRTHIGLLLVGWGVFNVVEGVIDHHLLRVHVRDDVPDPLPWDFGFLAFGAVLVVAGTVLWQTARRVIPAR